MKVAELIEMLKSREDWRDVVSVELYEFVGKRKSFHTDCIEYIDDYSEQYDDSEVVDWSVMDCEEMNRTLYANGCMSAEDCYGEEDKVLAIAIIKKKQFKVRGLYTISFEMMVEADSEEEAMREAESIDIETEWNGQSVFVYDSRVELNADGTIFDIEVEEE